MAVFRFTRKRTLVLAALGILLPTAFLAFLSIRLQREMFGFQNHILEETAHFTADHAVSQVQDRIRAKEREIHMHFRMVALLQRFDPATELARVEATYPYVDRAFLLRPDRSVAFSQRSDGDSLRDRAARILDEVLDSDTFEHLLGSTEAHFFRGQEGGEPFHLTAFGLFDAKGQAYGVAGFFLHLPYVRERFLARVLEEAIESATERFSPRFGQDLAFAVYDQSGRLVYPSASGDKQLGDQPGESLAEAELWDVLPGWTVRLHYASPKGPKYQRDIWLSNTLLLAVMGVIAIGGILVSMRFLLRQMELAHLKSHFVSNITHELKTPLAAIRLYTETLKEGRFHDEQQEKKFLGIIHKETVRLTHLINNILDFARIEQGKKRYHFEPASVGEVVRGVLDAYAYQLRSKGFEVQLEVQPDLPPVWLDRDALSQAVLNLLDNAMKYSAMNKGIDVHVLRANGSGGESHRARPGGTAASEPGGEDGAVQIVVSDHGIGIAPREQSRVFDAFYRIEKGLEHDVKGSGLGLAVVKHVVEAHGGTVRLESRQGEGSTFTLRLPVNGASQRAAQEARDHQESKT